MFDIHIAAYCLMSNHYHLLLQTPAGNLARAMRHINGVYTQRFNRHWKTDGQLFRGRYKSILVEEDSHLLELLRYIHRNPVRTNICKSVNTYPWSSHSGYMSNDRKWDWIHKASLLGMFSQDSQKARKQYRDFVQLEDSDTVVDFFNKKHLPSFFGSTGFIEWVKAKYYHLKNHSEIPESKLLAPGVSEIKQAVCQFYQVSQSSLSKSRRGTPNEPRNVAIYIARKRVGLNLEEIGKEFNLEKYSSVSSIVVRMEKQIAENTKLRKNVDSVFNAIRLRQAKI